MKTAELVNVYKNLNAMKEKRLPVKLGYAIARNIRKAKDTIDSFDDERQALINQYGEKNDDGSLKVADDGNVKITDPEAFNSAMKVLLLEEVTDDFVKVSSETVLSCEGENYDVLSVEELTAIDFMIEE